MKHPQSSGIRLKKYHGQNFLRDTAIVQEIVTTVPIKDRSIFEIGCGDGFLTREIVGHKPARLWIFEIDQEWATKVAAEFASTPSVTMFHKDFLEVDFSVFAADQPWTLLANLPYHLTFPILKKLLEHRAYLREGVIMLQEEVAQKIVKTRGRGYGFISLLYQHYFEWRLLSKVAPTAFFPAPKVYSRLLYFKPRAQLPVIHKEEAFWKFIQLAFSQPRRTLKNTLSQSHFDIKNSAPDFLALRAQQLNFDQLNTLWNQINQLSL